MKISLLFLFAVFLFANPDAQSANSKVVGGATNHGTAPAGSLTGRNWQRQFERLLMKTSTHFLKIKLYINH